MRDLRFIDITLIIIDLSCYCTVTTRSRYIFMLGFTDLCLILTALIGHGSFLHCEPTLSKQEINAMRVGELTSISLAEAAVVAPRL